MKTERQTPALHCPCGATGFPHRMFLARHLSRAHPIPSPRAIRASQCAEEGTPWPDDVMAVFRGGGNGSGDTAAPPTLPDDAALDQVQAAQKAQKAPGRAILTGAPSPPSDRARRTTAAKPRPDSPAPERTPDPTPSAQPAASGIGAGPGRGTAGAPKSCPYCKRRDGTHTEKCYGRPENRQARCVHCKNLGELCFRHGGISHSSSGPNRAALRARNRARAASGNGAAARDTAWAAARIELVAEIAKVETHLADLRAAHAMLVKLGGG